MGLIEQIRDSGSVFNRGAVVLSNTPTATGYTTEFGSTYILLGVSATAPCRVRLYAESSSVAIDSSRPSSSFDYSASVALSLDTGLIAGTQSITFNPPVIATTLLNSSTWYNIESSTVPTTVTFTYYPIEFYTGSRTFLNIPRASGVSIGANQTSSGNFSGSLVRTVPKSFLMLTAISPSSSVRLRLYSRPIEDVPTSEKNRLFTTTPNSGSYLISDMMFDSASYDYPISPVLQGYNLENYISGSNRIGYIINNMVGSTRTILTAVRVYPLED